MRRIIETSLRFRLLVLGIAAGALVLGIALLPRAPVDTVPEFSPPYVEVQTEALGLSAQEVEQLITVPLEADLLNGVAWLDSIQSESIQSLSSIVLTFEPGTDPIRARQMVSERLTQAHALPNVSRPPVMLQPLSSSNRLMMVGLSSDDLSLIEMSVLARWNIRPRLMGVTGVANVAIWGQRERQLQVLVDPERLDRANVALDDVVETAGNALWVSPLTFLEASTPGTGGFIDTPNQRFGIQHVFPIDSADDLARVSLESTESEVSPGLRLGDVADVVEDHQPLIGDAILEGGPGLLLVVEKFPEANTLEVTRDVEAALAAMAPGLGGVNIDTTVFRQATFLESAIDNLTLTVLLALILAAIAVTGLLLSWRAAVVCLVAMVVSLATGALVLVLLGATINAMVVAGFIAAVTVVVDDAIIGATAILRRRRTSADAERPWASFVADAMVGTRTPLAYAAAVILLTVVPLLLIGGATGAFVPALLGAYAAALGAATVVGLTLTPALTYLLMRPDADAEELSPVGRRIHDAYGALLGSALRHGNPILAIGGATAIGVVVLFGFSMAPKLSASGIPAFEERDLLIHWDGPPGTSHTEMSRIVGQASAELRGLPGIRSVGAHLGRAITADQVVAVNSGEIWIGVEPDADYDATLASIQGVVDGYPGLERELITYPSERMRQILGGPAGDLTVRIFGQDTELLRAKAAEVHDRLGAIDGITAVEVEAQVDEPTIEIQVDLDAAAAHGLKPGDVRRAAATMLSGVQVGSLFDDQKVFDVVVWGAPDLRRNLTAVSELLIDTPDDGLVALGEVADVRIAPTPTVIRRDAVQRAIDVSATISGRDLGGVLDDVDAALATMEFPLESHAEVLGFAEERQAHLLALLAVAAGAAIGVILVLQAAFGSWRLALGVFVALQAALSGAVIAALLIGEAGGIGSLAGLLAILGLAVRNCVLLVARTPSPDEPSSSRDELVLEGARERLAPMLISAAVIAAVMAPFAVLGGRAGLEIAHPMALVVLGGLVTTTLTSLFIVPSLLSRSGRRAQPEELASSMDQVPEPQVIGAG
jgi:Cu/Ag efflux pump CusA